VACCAERGARNLCADHCPVCANCDRIRLTRLFGGSAHCAQPPAESAVGSRTHSIRAEAFRSCHLLDGRASGVHGGALRLCQVDKLGDDIYQMLCLWRHELGRNAQVREVEGVTILEVLRGDNRKWDRRFHRHGFWTKAKEGGRITLAVAGHFYDAGSGITIPTENMENVAATFGMRDVGERRHPPACDREREEVAFTQSSGGWPDMQVTLCRRAVQKVTQQVHVAGVAHAKIRVRIDVDHVEGRGKLAGRNLTLPNVKDLVMRDDQTAGNTR
jgi:hypothetical protein